MPIPDMIFHLVIKFFDNVTQKLDEKKAKNMIKSSRVTRLKIPALIHHSIACH